MNAVLAHAGVPFYADLLSEYGLDNLDAAIELGRGVFLAKLLDLSVDPPHAESICTKVFDTDQKNGGDAMQCEVDVTLWTHGECLDWLNGEIVKETSVDSTTTTTSSESASPSQIHSQSRASVSPLAILQRVASTLQEPENETIDGDTLLSMLSSVREMRDVLGLRTVSERQCFERRLLERTGLRGSLGGLYNADFLRAVQPLWSFHMGAENMAPMLYQLVRFAKPTQVCEASGCRSFCVN
jgi:hypothetical protein